PCTRAPANGGTTTIARRRARARLRMASTVSWDALRELAGFRAAKGVAVSLYLSLDPTTTPTAGDVQTRVNSLLAEAARQLDRNDLTHDQRQGLKADLDRIRTYL